jgi:hypothetical protein
MRIGPASDVRMAPVRVFWSQAAGGVSAGMRGARPHASKRVQRGRTGFTGGGSAGMAMHEEGSHTAGATRLHAHGGAQPQLRLHQVPCQAVVHGRRTAVVTLRATNGILRVTCLPCCSCCKAASAAACRHRIWAGSTSAARRRTARARWRERLALRGGAGLTGTSSLRMEPDWSTTTTTCGASPARPVAASVSVHCCGASPLTKSRHKAQGRLRCRARSVQRAAQPRPLLPWGFSQNAHAPPGRQSHRPPGRRARARRRRRAASW